jgi:hypothetical protein
MRDSSKQTAGGKDCKELERKATNHANQNRCPQQESMEKQGRERFIRDDSRHLKLCFIEAGVVDVLCKSISVA